MTELTLILLRHAKADPSTSEADIDRPLNADGRRQAQEAGRWLADHVDGIDLAVISPAVRARTTWELAAAKLGTPPQDRIDDRVYNASVADLLEVVRELPDTSRSVALVGHNPGMEELASFLSHQSVPMSTSTIAVLEAASDWSSAGASWATLRVAGRPPA